MHYLYEVVNTVNDKKYIGATSNLVQRKCIHFSDDTKCTKLKNAVKKFGRDKFSLNVLVIGEKDYILDLENKAIALYNTVKNGYNTYRHNGFRPSTPEYVSGFWFDTQIRAINTLGVKTATFDKWVADGVEGETYRPMKGSILERSIYVRGFWFRTVVDASNALNMHYKTLDRIVARGDIEEFHKDRLIHLNSGSSNGMYGRTGSLNPKSRPVIIHGVLYESITCASRALDGFSYKMIFTRLKNKKQGFAYAD